MILNQSKSNKENPCLLQLTIPICILIFYSLSGDHVIRYSQASLRKLDNNVSEQYFINKTYKPTNNRMEHNRTIILIWYPNPVHA